MARCKINISGKVIGVFFRDFIRRSALSLNLKGYVKNTENEVKAVFEGEERDILEMIRLCKKGPKEALVKDIKIIKEKDKKEFKDFKIVY